MSDLKQQLNLRTGEWVEVRPEAEILSTLDDLGCLDGLPFMPEMLRYCGRRFRVQRVAHKTCDTIEAYKGRRMRNAVHLEELRCDGAGHDGCQAACLIFWKEAWLKRAAAAGQDAGASGDGAASIGMQQLLAHARYEVVEAGIASQRYRCQATDLLRATTPLPWYAPWQYLADLRSGNVSLREMLRYGSLALFNAVMRLRWPWRQTPRVTGQAGASTPTETLDLKAGEWVQVRSKEEIFTTLNATQKNRGLFFDVEMLPACGGRYKVLQRVEKIVDEKTGKMIRLPGSALILDRVVCSGRYSRDRMFCPRAIYPYWREVWLRRAAAPADADRGATSAAS